VFVVLAVGAEVEIDKRGFAAAVRKASRRFDALELNR
jgi:hypothetical protein